jgi:hypothetical protein
MTSNARTSCDSSSRPASAERVRCACCGADVARGESKVCAICRQPTCPACTRWYGHFMLVCDDCRLATW